MKFILIFLVFLSISAQASEFEFKLGGIRNFEYLMSYFDQNSIFYNCEINVKKEADVYHIYIKRLFPVIEDAVLTVELNDEGKNTSSLPLKVELSSKLELPEYRLLEHLKVRSDILGEPIEVTFTKIENDQMRRIVCAPEL